MNDVQVKDSKEKGYSEFSHEFFDTFEGKDVSVSIRFGKPTPQATERAQKQMMKSPNLALKNLCLSAVHPDDKEQMQQTFKEYSGLASTFGGALLKACGFGELGN
jgi:hypothetical protein